MEYWEGGGVVTLLFVALLLLVARQVHRTVPAIKALAVPPVLVAGLAGLMLGGGGLGLIPLDSDLLELIVYHSLAVVFVAMGLRRARKGGGGLPPEAKSVGFGIPFIAVMQGLVGLSIVLAWNGAVGELHPGVGIMVPLGFSQGPGQALSLGATWEGMGMKEGAQIGLAMATLGYAFCAVFGVIFFHLAKRMGWTDHDTPAGAAAELMGAVPDDSEPVEASSGGGNEMELFTAQLAIVGTIYLMAWGILMGAVKAAGDPQSVGILFGFHYLIALLIAMGLRAVANRTRYADFADDALMGRIAGLAVDVGAVCAIAAVRPDRIGSAIVPVLVLALAGVVATIVICLWLAKRVFPSQPFSHALVLFGTMTGTLPTGLALLRLSDPDLNGPAARNMVMGVTLSIAVAAPVLLVLLPMPVAGWPESFPVRTWMAMGGMAVYAVLVLVLWRYLGPLRFLSPLWSPWPKRAAEPES